MGPAAYVIMQRRREGEQFDQPIAVRPTMKEAAALLYGNMETLYLNGASASTMLQFYILPTIEENGAPGYDCMGEPLPFMRSKT